MPWVDAVCINQKNNKEKAQQVRLLPKTFQTATSTYAFLEGGKASDTAMEMLMQIRAKAACDKKSKLNTYATSGTDSEPGNGSKCETTAAAGSTEADGISSNDGTEPEDWPEDLPNVPESWNERCIPRPDDAIWASVGVVFSLSWFRRARLPMVWWWQTIN